MPEDASASPPDMEVAVLSDAGKREENQDWMSWSKISWGECYIVADGMGGYKGGALAARMTVEGLERHLKAQPPESPFDKALQEATRRTNSEVHSAAQSGNAEMDRMGSTVVVALVSGSNLYIGHIGDSRIYLFRGKQLKLLTTDHTSVQRMVEAGMLTPEQARDHPEAHILSRAVGSKAEVEIEVAGPIQLQPGDGILLCSDGLTGYVADKEIEKVLARQRDVQRVPRKLLELALASGSDDNITVQFVRYGRKKRHTSKLAILPGAESAARVHDFFRQAGSKRGAAVAFTVAAAVLVLWQSTGTPDQHGGSTPIPPGTARSEARDVPAGPPAKRTGETKPASSRPDPGKTLAVVPPGSSGKTRTKVVTEPIPPAVTSPGAITPGKDESSPAIDKDVLEAPRRNGTPSGSVAPAKIRVVILANGVKRKADTVIRALKTSGDFAPERLADDLGEPPPAQFIFYSDASEQAARRLEELLKKKTPWKQWKRGPYKGDRIRQYRQKIERDGEEHLLVVFPKGN